MADTSRYLDQKTAADLMRLTVRTLERMRRDGGGPPFVRIGLRRIVYSEADIHRWLASRTYAHRAAELARSAA
jgi:predicted DNA-binding transcriptional regulator AlpA